MNEKRKKALSKMNAIMGEIIVERSKAKSAPKKEECEEESEEKESEEKEGEEDDKEEKKK